MAFAGVRSLAIGLDNIALGNGIRLRTDLFAASLDELTVHFHSFVPNRVHGCIRDLRLTDVALRLGDAPA
jgi:hypothetical protein